MAWTGYQTFLALLMIVTGSINTLATKWADDAKAAGSDGIVRPFNHPFVQSLGMFFGEFTCLIAFKILFTYHTNKGTDEEDLPMSIKGSRTYNRFIFALPAMCDLFGTSMMYVGLNMTTPSSFQMLRGSLIIFTGVFSRIFLGKRKQLFEWLGIMIVIIGLVIVGANDLLGPTPAGQSNTNMIIGDILIIVGQIATASQMVIEEKFVSGSNVSALEAVGFEGLFGFLAMGILLLPFYYINVGNKIFTNPHGSIEDIVDAVTQMGNNWQIIVGLLGTVVSISFFNFAGISVTKELSATTRTVLDTVRTFVIWIISMCLKWESWEWMKAGGFAVLLVGMFLYNDVGRIGTRLFGPRSLSQENLIDPSPADVHVVQTTVTVVHAENGQNQPKKR